MKSIQRQLIAFAAVSALIISPVYADGSYLKLNDVVSKVIDNSSALKKQQNLIKQVKKDLDNAKSRSNEIESRIYIDDRFRYLIGKSDKTPEEQQELQIYYMYFWRPFTQEEKVQYIKMRDTSVLNLEYSLKTNEMRREMTLNSITLAASEQYSNILKLKDSIKLQKDTLAALEKNYKQAQDKLKLGKASKQDVQILSMNLAKARLELKKLERNFDTMVINLNKSMGEPMANKYSDFENIIVPVIPVIKPLEYYLDRALKNRYEIISTAEYLEIKKKEYQITKDILVWDMNRDVMSEKLYLDEALDNHEKAKIDVEIEILSAYKDLENMLKNYEGIDKAYETARYNYVEGLKKQKLGLITERKLSDLLMECTKYNIQHTNARRDIWLQGLKLEYASGLGPGFANGMR